MRLKYEKYAFERHSDNIQAATFNYKSLIEKTFEGIPFKKTSLSPILVVKNKKQYFQLFLNSMRALIFTSIFHAPNFWGRLHEICPVLMHILRKISEI